MARLARQPGSTQGAQTGSAGRCWLRRFVIAGAIILVVLLAGVLIAWLEIRKLLRSSLPVLSGTIEVPGLKAEVRIDRDDLGVPTIRASQPVDIAFGLGFVHAQDRFFQMDAIRRSAAGELAEIIGPGTGDLVLKHDRSVRIFRFRDVAGKVLARMSEGDRQWLDGYVRGVNAGLSAMKGKPFEYWLLGMEPKPWAAEDSVLAILAMFLDLQGKDYDRESALGLVRDVLPGPLAEFLCSKGSTDWDAPIAGGPIPAPPIPGPEDFDLRREPAFLLRDVPPDPTPLDEMETLFAASNNWAVSGQRSAHGGAIIANDMHLPLRVPNTWYRASWTIPAPIGQTASPDSVQPSRVTGATLPGGPAVVIGSNGQIAWGLTNSGGNWSDLIEIEVDPNDPDCYRSPAGKLSFERHREVIKIKGQADRILEIRSTIWGPIIDQDHKGRARALRWVALDPEGVNLNLVRLATVQDLDNAMALAPTCGVPHVNLLVADARGRIGWTIMGRIPRRTGEGDSLFPLRGRDQAGIWQGYYGADEAPRVVDPPEGRLWTANARVVDGPMLEKIGFGDYDRGCRAGMIRDRLRSIDKTTEEHIIDIQFDDRAVFLERWKRLLLDHLTPDHIAGNPLRGEFKQILEGWRGRAAIDSAAYRLVWEIRLRVVRAVLSPLTARCRAADARFRLAGLECEAPTWALVSQRPAHLLDPAYPDWTSLILAVMDAALEEASPRGKPLAEYTWGKKNIARIQHPISMASPLIGRWLKLDMPATPLPGGRKDMPRIQSPTYGASQRMAVSPGREAEGYFHMPCGQSGHPLSPHYRDGHKAWESGEPTPFLPGPTVNSLLLRPALRRE
jgi:penicillin amidase